MNFTKKIKNQKNLRNALLKSNHQDIQSANSTMLNGLLYIGVISFGLLIILSFILKTYKLMRLPYFAIFVIILMVFCIHKFCRQISTIWLLYISYGVLIGVSIYTSCFITKTSMSALVLIFLLQIPIVILDKSWRINLMELLSASVYFFFMVEYKANSLILDEAVNIVAVSITGMMLGHHLRKAQIDNFEMKRLALIGEYTDSLTGLYNRRKLFECLSVSQKLEIIPSIVGILMIDIDDFKLYNDTYGHQAGDECLKKISAYLLSFSQNHHITFYRYGGEEFLGVAYKYSQDDLFCLCQEITSVIHQMKITHKVPLYHMCLSVWD